MHSAEPIDPSHSFDDDFSVQDDDFVYAEDSVSDCVSTGLEAEALLKRYGGDLYLPSYNKAPGEFASNTPSDAATFFRTRTSDEAGIELPLGFSREYDNIIRVLVVYLMEWLVPLVKVFGFRKKRQKSILLRKKLWRSVILWLNLFH